MQTAHVRAVVLFLFLAVASTVRADAIEGPPTSCPAGANGTASHAGSWCTPADCDPTTDCDAATRSWASTGAPTPGRYTCQQHVGLCVRTTTVPSGGMAVGGTITKREALSACHTNADCPTDVACDFAARCAESSVWTSPASPASRTFWQRAFSCDDSSGAPTHNAGLLLGLSGLGLALVLARRRRS